MAQKEAPKPAATPDPSTTRDPNTVELEKRPPERDFRKELDERPNEED